MSLLVAFRSGGVCDCAAIGVPAEVEADSCRAESSERRIVGAVNIFDLEILNARGLQLETLQQAPNRNSPVQRRTRFDGA